MCPGRSLDLLCVLTSQSKPFNITDINAKTTFDFVVGLAYIGGICGDGRQSIMEDFFEFGMMVIAAHELGHK